MTSGVRAAPDSVLCINNLPTGCCSSPGGVRPVGSRGAEQGSVTRQSGTILASCVHAQVDAERWQVVDTTGDAAAGLERARQRIASVESSPALDCVRGVLCDPTRLRIVS